MTASFDQSKIDWAKVDGLIPVVVQDASALRVLMLGYMNAAALDATLASGLVTFYSRTKQRLWQKGETSGHVLRLRELKLDCDGDTLLALVEPVGPTCHTGARTCFGNEETPGIAVLADLAATIRARRQNPREGSYTARLFAEGLARCAQKVGEEGVEVALAAATKADNLKDEAADLFYHLLVLLEARDLDWREVMAVLAARAGK